MFEGNISHRVFHVMFAIFRCLSGHLLTLSNLHLYL